MWIDIIFVLGGGWCVGSRLWGLMLGGSGYVVCLCFVRHCLGGFLVGGGRWGGGVFVLFLGECGGGFTGGGWCDWTWGGGLSSIAFVGVSGGSFFSVSGICFVGYCW